VNLREALRAGSREIYANKARSTLSFAAVSVGVASLLYTLAQTRGMQESLKKNLDLMGPGRITVEAKSGYTSKGLSEGLTLADAEAIRRQFPDLYMVFPWTFQWSGRFYHGSLYSPAIKILGTGPQWRKRDWVYKLRGRFINQWDEDHQARVCVLVLPPGWHKKPFWANFWHRDNPYEQYALHHDLLGQHVRLDDSYFTVVGVLTPPPRDLDPRWESWNTPNAIVPISTFQLRLQPSWVGPRQVGMISIDTGSEATLSRRRRDIHQLLLSRHRGEQDFEINDMREAIETELEKQRKYVKAALALGIVALLAGGIGIMNVTLAAIFSRVREIGIRRAVGASPADILAQFVLEAGLLGAAGGVAGVGIGLGGVYYLKQMTGSDVARMSWLHCLAAVAVGAAISAAFAAVPAWQASRLDPVEALKAE
jgi:putative ABC transport system permease protein